MIKKGINLILILLMINTVSASSLDYFVDTNSLILIGVLLFVFYISYFAISKTMKDSNTAIKAVLALSIALFTTWKFQSSNIDITPIMFNLGLGGFIESYGPAIILLGLMIAMFIWGFCGVILIAGMIVTFIGYIGQNSGILYNGWALTLAGSIMSIVGLLCIYKSYIKKIHKFGQKINKRNGITMCGFFALIGAIIAILGLIIVNLTFSIIGVVIWIFAKICPGKKKNKENKEIIPFNNDNEKKIKVTRGPLMAARFDLYFNNWYNNLGGSQSLPRKTMNVGDIIKFTIKNGGSGGILKWDVWGSRGIKIKNKSHGKLTSGKSYQVVIKITEEFHRQAIIIRAKRGGSGGRWELRKRAIAAVSIPIKTI